MTESQVVEAPEAPGDEVAASDEPQSSSGLEGYVRDALHGVGMKVSDLTDDQRARAADAPEKNAGLRDKELTAYILDGKDPAVKAPKQKKPRAARAVTPRANKKYPEDIMSAVARARTLSEAKDPEKAARGEHIGYAGPAQHQKVRAFVTQMIEGEGGTVSRDLVLAASGVKSVRQMRDIATFKADREAMKPLRGIGSAFEKDGWAKGRYLAAILTVWLEDIDATV